MTRAGGLRVLSYLATFAAGAVLGAGLIFGFWTTPLVEMLSLATVSHSDDRAYIAYRYGAYSAAREAVLQHVELAQRFAREQELTLGKGKPGDLMVWYARLAVVAEKSGANEDASGFWQRAIDVATNDGGRVTEEDVRKVVRELDAHWDRRLSGTGS